jgi:ABC-type nitrate/sulfonate/bicarbonate transport system substrate-binding protein
VSTWDLIHPPDPDGHSELWVFFMRYIRALIISVLIGAIGFPAILSIEGCPSKAPVIPEKLTIGLFPGPQSSLIFIAHDLGIFQKNGIDVSIREYEYGLLAADDLIAGNIDMATVSEFVFASKSFQNADLSVLTTINQTDDLEIIGRRDRGIREPGDLNGKKIGVTRGTNVEFFLESFLTFNNIPTKNVKIVDLRPSEMTAAISSGRVDAVSTFPPHTDMANSSLGSNAVRWPSQAGQTYYFALITKESFIKSHGGSINRVLLSLLEAARYVEQHKADAQKIIEKRLNMDHAKLLSIWPQYQFRVRLDQDLLILMEDEARWMIRTKHTHGAYMPDYFKHVYIDGLRNIEPNAVGIIH